MSTRDRATAGKVYDIPVPTDKKGAPQELLELREAHVVPVLEAVPDNTITIAYHEARSGSSSLTKLMEQRLAQRYTVSELAGTSSKLGVELDSKVRKWKKAQRDDPNLNPLLIVLDEAGSLLRRTTEAAKGEDDAVDLIEDTVEAISALKNIGGKMIFMTHEGGREGMVRFIDSMKSGEFEGDEIDVDGIDDLDTADVYVESVDKEILGQIVAKVCESAHQDIRDNLIAHQGNIVDLAHSPQQAMFVINQYIELRSKGKNDAEAWASASSLDSKDQPFLYSMESSIATTGGQPLKELLRKVSAGSLTADDLGGEERALLDKVKPYHFFETDAEGKLSVRGKLIEQYVTT